MNSVPLRDLQLVKMWQEKHGSGRDSLSIGPLCFSVVLSAAGGGFTGMKIRALLLSVLQC